MDPTVILIMLAAVVESQPAIPGEAWAFFGAALGAILASVTGLITFFGTRQVEQKKHAAALLVEVEKERSTAQVTAAQLEMQRQQLTYEEIARLRQSTNEQHNENLRRLQGQVDELKEIAQDDRDHIDLMIDHIWRGDPPPPPPRPNRMKMRTPSIEITEPIIEILPDGHLRVTEEP